MQVTGRRADIRVPSRVADLRQGVSGGQGQTDEGVPSMVDGELLLSLGA